MNGALSLSQKSEINEQEYPQDKITHYVFGQCIGRGSFGSVYYCLHRESRNEFAAKIMSKRYLSKKFFIREFNIQDSSAHSTNHSDTGDELNGCKSSIKNANQDTILSYLDLAYQEIEVMKSFRHPCLLRLYEVIQSMEMDKLLMIMDLAEGPISSVTPSTVHINTSVTGLLRTIYNSTDLDNLLEYSSLCCTPMPLLFLRKAILHITLGLYALHAKDYVHADIKAANVLRLANGNFVLGDFSLTNHVSITRTMSAVVSMAYASPDNRGLTKENDIWAFGVTLFMLLFGRHPASLCLHILVSQLPPPGQNIPLIVPDTPKRLHHWSDVLRDAPDALTNILNVNTTSPHAAIIKIIVGCLELDYKKRFTIPQIYDLIINEHIKNMCYRVTNKLTLQLMCNFYKIQANVVLGSGLPSHVTDQYTTSRFAVDLWNRALGRRAFYTAGEGVDLDLSVPLVQLIIKKNYITFITDIVPNLDPTNEHAANFLISLALLGVDGDIDVYFYCKFVRLFLLGAPTKRSFDMFWSDLAYLLHNSMDYKRLHTSRTLKGLNLLSITSDDSDASEEQRHIMLENRTKMELAPEIYNLEMGSSPMFEFEQRTHYFVENMLWNFAFNRDFARTRILLMKQGLRPTQLIFYEVCMLRQDLARSIGPGEMNRSRIRGKADGTPGRLSPDYTSMVQTLIKDDDNGGATSKTNQCTTSSQTTKELDSMNLPDEDAYGAKGYDGGNLFSSTLGVLGQDRKSLNREREGSIPLTHKTATIEGLFFPRIDQVSTNPLPDESFEEIDVAKLATLFSKQYISEYEIHGTGLYADNFSFGSGNKANKNKVCVVAGDKEDITSLNKSNISIPFMKDLFNLDSKKDQNSILGLGSFSLAAQPAKKTQPARKNTTNSDHVASGKKKVLDDDDSSSDSDIVAIEASNSDDMDRAFGLGKDLPQKRNITHDVVSDNTSSYDSDIEFVNSDSKDMDEAFGLNSDSSASEVYNIMDLSSSTDSSDSYSNDDDIVIVGSDSNDMDVAFGLVEGDKKSNEKLARNPKHEHFSFSSSFEAILTPEDVPGVKKAKRPKNNVSAVVAQSFDEFDETLEDRYMADLSNFDKELYGVSLSSKAQPLFMIANHNNNEDEQILQVISKNNLPETNFSFGSFTSVGDAATQLFSKRPLLDRPDQDAPSDVIETIGEDSVLVGDPFQVLGRSQKKSISDYPQSEKGSSCPFGIPESSMDTITTAAVAEVSLSSNSSNRQFELNVQSSDEDSSMSSRSIHFPQLYARSRENVNEASPKDSLSLNPCDNESTSSSAFALDIERSNSDDIVNLNNLPSQQVRPPNNDSELLETHNDNLYKVHLSFHNESIEYNRSDPTYPFMDLHGEAFPNSDHNSSSEDFDSFVKIDNSIHDSIAHSSDARINLYLKASEMHIPEEHMALLLTRTVILLVYSTWAMIKRFNHKSAKSASLFDAYTKFYTRTTQILGDGTQLYNNYVERLNSKSSTKLDDEILEKKLKLLFKYGTDKSRPYVQARALSNDILLAGEDYIRILNIELGTHLSIDDFSYIIWPTKEQDQNSQSNLDLDGFLRFTPDNYKIYLQSKLASSTRNSNLSQMTDASILDVQNSSFSRSMDFQDISLSLVESNVNIPEICSSKPNVMATVPSMSITKSQLAKLPLPKADSISNSKILTSTLPPQDGFSLLSPHPPIHDYNTHTNTGFYKIQSLNGGTETKKSVAQNMKDQFNDELDLPDLLQDEKSLGFSSSASDINATNPRVSQLQQISPEAANFPTNIRTGGTCTPTYHSMGMCRSHSSAATFSRIGVLVTICSAQRRNNTHHLNAHTFARRLSNRSSQFNNIPTVFRVTDIELRRRMSSPRYGDTFHCKRGNVSVNVNFKDHYNVRESKDMASLTTDSATSDIDKRVAVIKGDEGLFELFAQSSPTGNSEIDGNKEANEGNDLINSLRVSSGLGRLSPHIKSAVTSMPENSDMSKSALQPLSQEYPGFNRSFNETPLVLTLADKQKRLDDLISRSIYPFLVFSWRWTKQQLLLNACGLNPNKGWVILSVVDVANFLQGIVNMINMRSTTTSFGTDAPQLRLYCNENIILEPRSLQNSIVHSRLPKTIRETVEIRQNVHDLWVNIGLDAAERSPLVGIRHSTKERQGYIIRRSSHNTSNSKEDNKYEGELNITRSQACTKKASGKIELKLQFLFDLLECKNENALGADATMITMNVGGKEIYGTDRYYSEAKQDDQSSSDCRYAIPSGYKVLNTCLPAPGGGEKPVSVHRFSRNIPTGDYFTFLYADSMKSNIASFRDNLVPGDKNYLANWLIETDKIERPIAQMDEVLLPSHDTVSVQPAIESQSTLPSILSAASVGLTSQPKLPTAMSTTLSHTVVRRKSISAANLFALYPTPAIGATSEHIPSSSPEQSITQPSKSMDPASANFENYCCSCIGEENSLYISSNHTTNIKVESTSCADEPSRNQVDLSDLENYDFQLTGMGNDTDDDVQNEVDLNNYVIAEPSIHPSLSLQLTEQATDVSETPDMALLVESAQKDKKTSQQEFPMITSTDYEALADAQRLDDIANLTDVSRNSTLQSLCVDDGVYVNRMSFEEHVFMPHIFLEIFLDLIINARQYSKPSIVRAALFNCQESLYLIVNDCGIGLPKQCWQHVFFHQKDLLDISQCLGSGLARAILITRAYGGIINVSSCKNGGTRLILKIPLPKETTFVDAQ